MVVGGVRRLEVRRHPLTVEFGQVLRQELLADASPSEVWVGGQKAEVGVRFGGASQIEAMCELVECGELFGPERALRSIRYRCFLLVGQVGLARRHPDRDTGSALEHEHGRQPFCTLDEGAPELFEVPRVTIAPP